MERLDEGVAKWATLGLCIGALEFFGDESLTHAFDRAMQHDKMKYVALGGLALTGAHLLDLIPHKPIELDPYYLVARAISKLGDTTRK